MVVFNEMLHNQLFGSSSLAVLMVSLNSSEQLLVLLFMISKTNVLLYNKTFCPDNFPFLGNQIKK